MSVVAGLRGDFYAVSTDATPGYNIETVIAGANPPIDPATLPDPAGASYSRNALTGDVGVVANAGGGVSPFARVGRSYRHPNLEEMLFAGPATIGSIAPNVLVRPEIGTNFDAGANLRFGRVSGAAYVFVNQYRDFIAQDLVVATTPTGPLAQATNYADVRISGVELSATAPIVWRRGVLTLTGAGAFTRGTITEGVDPLTGESLDGTPADNITPSKLIGSARFTEPGGRWWVEYGVRTQADVTRVAETLHSFAVRHRAGPALARRLHRAPDRRRRPDLAARQSRADHVRPREPDERVLPRAVPVRASERAELHHRRQVRRRLMAVAPVKVRGYAPWRGSPSGAMIACALLSACGRAPSTPVTFNKDVAPIVFANCATCHRPGGDGPFSLLTYADAARHATEIGTQTLARHMPPWLPEPGDVPIAGVRRLSAVEIDTVQRWIRDGALEGAAGDLPAPPSFSSDGQLGKPDLVLTMPRPYVLHPGKEDVYRNVILDGSVPDDVFIRAVELRRNGSPIHHAMVRLARLPPSRAVTTAGGWSAGIQRNGIGDPSGSGRAVPGMGAGPRTDGLARWHAVASRARHRRRAGTAPRAVGPSGQHSAERGAVFLQRARRRARRSRARSSRSSSTFPPARRTMSSRTGINCRWRRISSACFRTRTISARKC